MQRVFAFVTVALVAGVAVASAQTPAAGNAVSGSVRQAWDDAKKNIKDSAEVMPEEHYGFQPTKDVRTFGQILAHIAGANYEFCAAAKGDKAPHSEGAFEKTTTTRAAIIKVLGDSLTYCDAAYAGVNDRTLADPIELPFNMGKAIRSRALLGNIGHLNEHYGNLVTYFRIKGIVPPSSRR